MSKPFVRAGDSIWEERTAAVDYPGGDAQYRADILRKLYDNAVHHNDPGVTAGDTLNDEDLPHSGVMVSLPNREREVSSLPSSQSLQHYQHEFDDDLHAPGNFLGGWEWPASPDREEQQRYDANPRYYHDVSRNFLDPWEGALAGVNGDQREVRDLNGWYTSEGVPSNVKTPTYFNDQIAKGGRRLSWNDEIAGSRVGSPSGEVAQPGQGGRSGQGTSANGAALRASRSASYPGSGGPAGHYGSVDRRDPGRGAGVPGPHRSTPAARRSVRRGAAKKLVTAADLREPAVHLGMAFAGPAQLPEGLVPGTPAGGSHGAQFYHDPSGTTFVVKKAPSHAPYLADLDVAASAIQEKSGLETPATFQHDFGQGPASVQYSFPGIKPAFPGHQVNIDALSDDDLLTLQKNHALDWMIGNHDAHPGQFFRTPEGKLIGLDRGQAYKFFGKDKLNWHYWPNTVESEPIYNTLYQNMAKGGRALFDPRQGELAQFIQQLQSIPDDQYVQLLTPYAQGAAQGGELAGGDVDQFLKAAVARKNNLSKDFGTLYDKALAYRSTGMKVAGYNIHLKLNDGTPVQTYSADIYHRARALADQIAGKGGLEIREKARSPEQVGEGTQYMPVYRNGAWAGNIVIERSDNQPLDAATAMGPHADQYAYDKVAALDPTLIPSMSNEHLQWLHHITDVTAPSPEDERLHNLVSHEIDHRFRINPKLGLHRPAPWGHPPPQHPDVPHATAMSDDEYAEYEQGYRATDRQWDTDPRYHGPQKTSGAVDWDPEAYEREHAQLAKDHYRLKQDYESDPATQSIRHWKGLNDDQVNRVLQAARPDMNNLVDVTHEWGDLGSHGGTRVFRDPQGEWLFKRPNKGNEFVVPLDAATARLQHDVGLPSAETYVQPVKNFLVSAVKAWPGAQQTWQKPPHITDLSPQDLLTVQKHQALDWLLANHDAHVGNWLTTPDHGLVQVDKGQALKYFGQDRLDWDFHPNYYARPPIYNRLWKEFASGAPAEMSDPREGELGNFVQTLQNYPDDKFKHLFRPFAYAAAHAGMLGTGKYGAPGPADPQRGLTKPTIPPNDPETFLDALVQRKNHLQSELGAFYDRAAVHRASALLGGQPYVPDPDPVPKPTFSPGKYHYEHGFTPKMKSYYDEDDEDDLSYPAWKQQHQPAPEDEVSSWLKKLDLFKQPKQPPPEPPPFGKPR